MSSNTTPVILILVTNKAGKNLEHSQFYKIFSVFGTVKKILIFERKVIWKVFVEYDTHQNALKALTLDGTLFENVLKMRVHLSQRDQLTFQNNNNCGVDYEALASKQQFYVSLQSDSVQFNEQMQQNLQQINTLMDQLMIASQNMGDIKTYMSILNQIKEFRNQQQQLNILYQQQLRNYQSVLTREGKTQEKLQKKIQSASPSPSPSPYQQSTIGSISMRQIVEESSSDDEFRHSDHDDSDVDQKSEQSDTDNYDDVFQTQNILSYNSPDIFSPSPIAFKSQQKTFIIVQHSNTNLKVIFNLVSSFAKIESLFQSRSGAVIQFKSLEEAIYVRDSLNNKLMLGTPLIISISKYAPEGSQPVCLPIVDRKAVTQSVTKAIQVNNITASRDQLIQYFNCITPMQNLKFINSTTCKILYQDCNAALTVLGHLQDAKINGKSVQLSFTAF